MSRLNLGNSLILDTDYSESEVKTGATWIDGKPIYMKTYQVTTPNSSDTLEQVVVFTNVSTLVKVDGFVSTGYALNWFIATNNYFMTETTIDGIKMRMGTSTGLKSKDAYITAYYTKTTD